MYRERLTTVQTNSIEHYTTHITVSAEVLTVFEREEWKNTLLRCCQRIMKYKNFDSYLQQELQESQVQSNESVVDMSTEVV